MTPPPLLPAVPRQGNPESMHRIHVGRGMGKKIAADVEVDPKKRYGGGKHCHQLAPPDGRGIPIRIAAGFDR